MKILTSITDYFREVNLPDPKEPHFYVGRHEENLKRIKKIVSPIKHELYSISVYTSGESALSFNKVTAKKVFVRSPFREIEWSLTGREDLQGILVIFSNEFVQKNEQWKDFLIDFPFFRHSVFFNEDLAPSVTQELHDYFCKIHEYYYCNSADRLDFVKAWLQIALLRLRQEYEKRIDVSEINTTINKLMADFEILLLKTLEQPEIPENARQPSFYATRLFVHINHLNAVVKKITGKTTSEIINEHTIRKISAELRQKNIPVKEIAHQLHFSATTHFIAFFKKHTGFTPKQYRESF